MKSLQVALYARVSSEQQVEANTIASQLAALQAQIQADGVDPQQALSFIDEGYSGAYLARPALERLRDAAAEQQFERLYVLCPDRLARNYAHQALLVEELSHAGVEVIFLNRPLSSSPEDQLLLQVQGVIAEYERAKFLERSRRGKRYAAQAGKVSVLCNAPYGYRYVRAQEAGGTARFEVVDAEAAVVRQVFSWVAQERVTISEVRRRLQAAGIATRTGKPLWDHKTIWEMLQNPAYIGQAAFGRTHSGPLQPRLRAPRGRPAQSQRGYSPHNAPAEEWISIAVPALVAQELFVAVKEQLQENRQRARIPQKGSRYLLQGLLVCAECGYAYYGMRNDERNAYYRCSSGLKTRLEGRRLCSNKELRMDRLDEAVWQEVSAVLADPGRLEEEYRRRMQPGQHSSAIRELTTQAGKVRRGIGRLIDSYAAGLIEAGEFEPRVKRLRQQLEQLEEQVRQQQEQASEEEELRRIVERLEGFAAQVQAGLEQADWNTRRELIRTLVKRVEIDQAQVRVVFRIGPTAPAPPANSGSVSLQHCGERVLEAHL
jgi:site-specific DNA recombinase